jgi:hypothetical protein
MRRRIAAALMGIVASLLLASTALGHECVNASKPDQGAGAQVVIDAATGQPVWISQGVMSRLEHGVIDPATGEGLHGLIGIDFDGDGNADVSTWFGVGPEGDEIPEQAQFNGPACHGITNIGVYLSECLGG